MFNRLVPENLTDPRYRVNTSRPCPVCGKTGWCLSDGSTWAICQRVESCQRWKEAGWFHQFNTQSRFLKNRDGPPRSSFSPQSLRGEKEREIWLWPTLQAAEEGFDALISFRCSAEERQFFLNDYGLHSDDLPDSWRIFNHPKLGKGVVYRGSAPDHSPVFKFKGFARNEKGKRTSRFLYGLNGLLWFEQPDTDLVLVAGEEKALAAYQSGFSAVALMTGEKAPNEEIIKVILDRAPPRIVMANDHDSAGSKANKETAVALEHAGYQASKIYLVKWSEDAPQGFDLNDVLIGGGINAVREKIEQAEPYDSVILPATISASNLARKVLTKPLHIIQGIRPVGLSILGSKPKKGKSWLELYNAVSVAMGKPALGVFETEQGVVLYMALEDSLLRIQERLKIVTGNGPIPEDLYFATDWKRLDLGGIDELKAWLRQHPRAVMVIVDTLVRIKPPRPHNADAYQFDAEVTAELQRLALEFHIALVLILHQRKAVADDAFDTISGTLGLTASADVVSVLTREKSGKGSLILTGRDIEERTLNLHFDGGRWTYVGEADEDEKSIPVDRSKEFLLEILKNGPVSSREIFEQGKAQGLTEKKLRKAKDVLRITHFKTSYESQWSWSLPDTSYGNMGVDKKR